MADFKFKNLLVTGAAGFIGCNFVRRMLKIYSHIQIISLDKLTYAAFVEVAEIEKPRVLGCSEG